MCAAGLTHLDFCSPGNRRDTDISNGGIAALSALTNLRSLNFAGHHSIGPSGISFLAECTGLTSLDLSGVYRCKVEEVHTLSSGPCLLSCFPLGTSRCADPATQGCAAAQAGNITTLGDGWHISCKTDCSLNIISGYLSA